MNETQQFAGKSQLTKLMTHSLSNEKNTTFNVIYDRKQNLFCIAWFTDSLILINKQIIRLLIFNLKRPSKIKHQTKYAIFYNNYDLAAVKRIYLKHLSATLLDSF